MAAGDIVVNVEDLRVGYENTVVLRDISFTVKTGEIFGILGDSGAGKSTLLKHMIGLYPPMRGDVKIFGKSIVNCGEAEKKLLMRSFGVTYQGGALLGSLTVGENIALPIETYTDLNKTDVEARIKEKLALVDLTGTENLMPSELSGGMRKRAGLARALALDPELLFFDEPSAGLDPITSVELDELLLRLREKCNTTIVIVTHELASIFNITDTIIMLSKAKKTMVAEGPPKELREKSTLPWVHDFLNRQEHNNKNTKQEIVYDSGK